MPSVPDDFYDRILANAADLGALKEQSEASKTDRRDIWESLSALRKIAEQQSLILSKINDLSDGQSALADKLAAHEDKIGTRLTALELRDAQGQGAMAIMLAIASGFGVIFTFIGQWALNHFWPSGRA